MSYIGNSPVYQAFVTDSFSGNGSTTAFTMSVAPANTASVLVAVSGVLQDPSTYSVSGTTLTFSAAPPSGTGNISARYLGIPASGVTTTAYRTVTEFTATAGQTTFTPPSYTVGYINVYRNGVRLNSADYTATNGTTVVLTSGATAGDTVTTESFYVSSVVNAIPATANAINSTYLSPSLTITTPTLASPTINGTYTAGTSLITRGTAQASTSGTSIDFTGIPSWVKRITVMVSGLTLSGSASGLVQLGVSGTPTTTGYSSTSAYATTPNGGGACGGVNSTSGFIIQMGSSGYALYGSIVFTNISGNSWVAQGNFGNLAGSVFCLMAGGGVALGGTVNMLRITSTTGSDTFLAGTINILYE